MTDIERQMMEAMKDGGRCEMTLYHPGRQTERPLKFELDPGDSLDSDVAGQILDQIRGYIPTKIHVNGACVWTRPQQNSSGKAIVIDHDKVKVSY